MSRIGKLPVEIPADVKVEVNGNLVKVSGKLGNLEHCCNDEVAVEHEGNTVKVTPKGTNKRSKAMWGLNRTLVANMVDGVTKGFTKKLVVKGTGYRANLIGKKYLNLFLGYSHDIIVKIPDGVQVVVEKGPKDETFVSVSGFDKQLVGELAAKIRKLRKPEPYKGKGIRYDDERILRKEGKTK